MRASAAAANRRLGVVTASSLRPGFAPLFVTRRPLRSPGGYHGLASSQPFFFYLVVVVAVGEVGFVSSVAPYSTRVPG